MLEVWLDLHSGNLPLPGKRFISPFTHWLQELVELSMGAEVHQECTFLHGLVQIQVSRLT